MGFFSLFKKQPRISLEQLSYDIAYEIFPTYAYSQLPSLLDIVDSSPDSANSLFYLIACKAREVQPERHEAESYRWHRISAMSSRICLVLEYPKPVPIDLSGQSFEDIKKSAGSWTLAPYFSAVVMDESTGRTSYFVLGQTSMGGGSVLRSVSPDGENLNLGAGPGPELQAFLAVVDHHVSGGA